jgi:pimeloyl-ACP methyl ester carboxylesterase
MANLDPFRSPEHRAQFIELYDATMRAWPVPYEERDVSTSFGSTHVVVTGKESAPPLVLFHGAATTAAMWGGVIAPLSDVHRCYCIDTITDANKSVATKRVRRVPEYVAWQRETVLGLGLENASVAGLSYGGWLASLLGVHAPEFVNRLVLMSPAATLSRIATEWMARMVPAAMLHSRFLAEHSLQWAAARPDATDPASTLAVERFLSCRSLAQPPPPTRLTDDELRRISAPTTVLLGDREVIYAGGPQAALARANRLIPGVHARLLPNAGHILTLDAPDVVVTEITAALT